LLFNEKFLLKFWAKINIKNNDDCWNWLGYLNSGYGVIGYEGKDYKAHRIAYMITYQIENLPSNIFCCHVCDNRKCCNPNHIFLGTSADNVHDMENKGRSKHPNGSKNGMAKISEENALEIRRLYATGQYNFSQLSKLYPINDWMIASIIYGKNWKNIGGDIVNTNIGRGAYLKKLNTDQVSEIKEMLKSELYTQKEIAIQFNIDSRTVSAINTNKTWRNVQ
jgi:hypothetical protein